MDERRNLTVHRDDSRYTISILLSDTKDFEGCDFYIFTEEFENFKNRNYINEYVEAPGQKLPIINFDQGDLLQFDSKYFHGVTPLKSGERYLLTIFYDMF